MQIDFGDIFYHNQDVKIIYLVTETFVKIAHVTCLLCTSAWEICNSNKDAIGKCLYKATPEIRGMFYDLVKGWKYGCLAKFCCHRKLCCSTFDPADFFTNQLIIFCSKCLQKKDALSLNLRQKKMMLYLAYPFHHDGNCLARKVF